MHPSQSGRGVPNQLATYRRNPPVDPTYFPPAEVCAQWYGQEAGRALTNPHPFAPAPYTDDAQRHACEDEFRQQIPDLTLALDEAVNFHFRPIQDAVQSLITIVRRRL